MHHFIFCKKDTLILNDEVLFDKNFSLDKFLEIGAVSKLDFNYEKSNLQSIFSNKLISENLINFTGNFTGSIHCASGSVSGIINCVSINQPVEFVSRLIRLTIMEILLPMKMVIQLYLLVLRTSIIFNKI